MTGTLETGCPFRLERQLAAEKERQRPQRLEYRRNPLSMEDF
jgi:hypothetical protein